ncbi:MAG: hypothetical protein IT382_17190 [Deltaproteobacteria bacterium]|nr:hypothetical protein [Deltaproteobacteria bacterium]
MALITHATMAVTGCCPDKIAGGTSACTGLESDICDVASDAGIGAQLLGFDAGNPIAHRMTVSRSELAAISLTDDEGRSLTIDLVLPCAALFLRPPTGADLDVSFGGTELADGYLRITHPDGRLWLEGGAYAYDGPQLDQRRTAFLAGDSCGGEVCRERESATLPASVEFQVDDPVQLATGESENVSIDNEPYMAIVLKAVEQGCHPDAEDCGGPLGQAFLIQLPAESG